MGKYRIRPGYISAKTSADIIVAALEDIAATGPLTAKRVVEASKPVTAPLHSEFEWNDVIAANAYREGQARTIIRACELVEEPEEAGQPQLISPVFVHVPDPNPHKEGEYIPATRLVENLDQFQRALKEALRRLEADERYVHFLRRLSEGQGESVAAQVAMAHEGFHVVLAALHGLQAV